ncbi:MAG TPA: TonB family protein [Candidatus Acidoferrales bacterium]|nr:TonB family protein [Candidatus Acidoferrales bacterium]
MRIPFNLIDRLEREAVEAFRSLSSRGSEIGGLLVGDVEAGSPLVVSIADYELISCDYARGPLYRLSEADMERFRRAMDQRKGGPGQTVAGFFRSHTRKGISLDADDLAFYQAVFRDPHHVALLVRPFATKASAAGIFIWEGGKINGDASYLEFPFRSSELGAKATEAPAPEAKAPAPPPAGSPAAPAKPPSRAQIVPIASRREVAVEPPPAPPVVSAPPPPSPAASPAAPPPAPKVEEKPAPVEQMSRFEETKKLDDMKGKLDKQVKKEASKPAETPKAAAPAKPAAPSAPPAAAKPAATAAAAPAPAKTPEKAPEKAAEKAAEKALEKGIDEALPAEASSGGKGVKLVLAALAAIALFVGLFVYPGFLRHSTKTQTNGQGDSSPLQLHVERSNGELLLTWNRDSDAIRNATKATLLINDGEQHENVDMDLSQLRNNGSIVYSPSSSDVSFVMEVVGRDQSKTTSEQVRVLRTRPSPLDTQQADAKPAASASTPATPAAKNSTPSNDKPAVPDTAVEQPVAQEAPKPVTPRREFNTASLAQRIRPAQPTDIPDAPTVGSTVSAALPGVNLPSAGAVPNAPVPPPPARPAATAPTPQVPAPSTNNVASLNKQGGQIQQAVLISRKEPEYPKIAKQTGAKGQVVLNATIGKDGHIKAVKVVSGHPMLQNAAVDAVKQWIYKPTLLNGSPVETETQIMLNFVGER